MVLRERDFVGWRKVIGFCLGRGRRMRAANTTIFMVVYDVAIGNGGGYQKMFR